ncbi:VacJ family lipoprotein [Pseudoxanthomonas sp. CF125]|uniref:MlaA family lipoprotein n=1 Tax=Pseudoxanthomonas sp. CF125 TaxID=1855303 RepID=UPI000B875BF1|nr:VacJ family lipoprotein [Pseudoxanthomonas sp. CF125]
MTRVVFWKVLLSLGLVASLVGCATVSEKQPHSALAQADTPVSMIVSDPAPAAVPIAPDFVPTVPDRVDVERDETRVAAKFVESGGDKKSENLEMPAGKVGIYDPWERYNRKMHRFNIAADRSVARPVARAYVKVVPAPVRSGVSNFFDNLGQPATAVNALLQGKVKHSAQALGRFVVNSTIGVAGIFDPASRMKLPERDEDFGQTLATWGWRRSRYFELPFFGPSTVRDAFGIAGDLPLQPLSYVEADKVRLGLKAIGLIDMRARLLAFDSLKDEVIDDYLLVRDTWSQHRNFRIKEDTGRDASLPDYLKE